MAVGPVMVLAATASNAWLAKIGSSGVNGSATAQAYTTGAGSIVLKLAKLRAATYQPVTLYKGTCSSVGAVLIKFPTIKTSSAGAAVRTSSLTAAQVTLIKKATAGTGRIAIRVGSATTGGVKCGAFAALAVPPYVSATITVGRSPTGAVVAPNGVWVTNSFDSSLSRIDPATNTVLQTIPLTSSGLFMLPEAIASGEGSLWVSIAGIDLTTMAFHYSILRIDPTSGAQLATVAITGTALDVEVSLGAVWVPLYDTDGVARIDPATNLVVATIPVPGHPTGVAFGAGSLWASTDDGSVARIDPATNQILATIHTQDTGGYVAFGGNAVWVTNAGHVGSPDGIVTRIDPSTNQVVSSVTVGSFPQQIAFAGGSVWVGLYDTPTVVQLSGTTNAIVSRVAVGQPVQAITATDHAVWAVHDLSAPDATSAPPSGVLTRIAY